MRKNSLGFLMVASAVSLIFGATPPTAYAEEWTHESTMSDMANWHSGQATARYCLLKQGPAFDSNEKKTDFRCEIDSILWTVRYEYNGKQVKPVGGQPEVHISDGSPFTIKSTWTGHVQRDGYIGSGVNVKHTVAVGALGQDVSSSGEYWMRIYVTKDGRTTVSGGRF